MHVLLHSAPKPAAGHHRPIPPPETPGHPQASPGQSSVGSLLLSSGSWCPRFCCALWESISQSCLSSGSQLWMWLVMEERSNAVKNKIAQEPGMLGPWSKQIGSGWTGEGKSESRHFWNQQIKMGKFNSDDHYISYCGQEFLRRNVIAIIVNKRVGNAILGCKNDSMISVRFQGKPFNIMVI